MSSTDTSRHECYECGASFTRKDNLSRHQLLHSISSHEESGGRFDRSTRNDSNSMREKSDYDSGTERSRSDAEADEETDAEPDAEMKEESDSEIDAEMKEETDEEANGEADEDTNEEEDEDSSGEEYDRAYDDDNKPTMRRVLRATRRAIRIMSEQFMMAEKEKESMHNNSRDVVPSLGYQQWNRRLYWRHHPYKWSSVHNAGCVDDRKEVEEPEVTPLGVLKLLKRVMRKARRGD